MCQQCLRASSACSDDFLLGKGVFLIPMGACFMKLKWSKKGNLDREKRRCPSQWERLLRSSAPHMVASGTPLGSSATAGSCLKGSRKLPAKSVPECRGGCSPVLGHCPEVGDPAGACCPPPPGQEMGLSHTAERHAAFSVFSLSAHCDRQTGAVHAHVSETLKYPASLNNCVFVSSGCPNRAPQTGGLQTFIFSQFGKPEVREPGEGQVTLS